MPILRVVQPFSAADNPRVYAAGDLVDAADPVVAGREHLFEAVEVAAARAVAAAGGAGQSVTVEAATAEPGEKRSVSTAKKSAAK